MHMLSILFFGLSSNMDNFAVGLSYGLKGTYIHCKANMVIGLITFFGTLLSMLLGKSLLIIIPVSIANIIGGVIITTIGCVYLIKFIFNKEGDPANQQEKDETPCKYDKDKSGEIDWREALALGCALSVNNIGLGVGAGITGLHTMATAICSLICSLLFIYASNMLGKNCLSKFLGQYSALATSILIIILGVYEIFV